jgi:nitrite reductase/ring-hydroxylating ferredoxin subunit
MVNGAANFVPQGHTYLCIAPLCAHDPLLMKSLSHLLLPLCILLLTPGCRKDKQVDVPLVNVDIEININLPEYNALAVTGGWAYVTGGSEGLIVYRKSPDEFTALDRHCTFQPEDLCRVTVDDSQVMARDTSCCHSAFLLLDGSVTEAPAVLGLKRYNTTFNGTILRIFN